MEKEILHGEEFVNEITDTDDSKLATGIKIPSSVKTPVGYLDNLRKYKDIYNDIYKQIEVCNSLYKYNSIIGSAVDVLVDFAVTDVRPEATGNKELDEILNHWFENLNESITSTLPGVYPLMQEIGLEWFTSGNAFPYNKWENVEINNKSFKLPMSIYLINPLSIHIPSDLVSFGTEVIYLKYDPILIAKLSGDGRSSPESSLIKQAIPRSVINQIKEAKSFSDGIRLNPKYITHLKRKAKNYQAWGVPYLTRCFSPISILERLRELDESISTGMLNLITLFKVGTKEQPASQARVNKFAALIRNPKATTTLVWAHDVEVQQIGPDGKVLAFKDKYKDAKEDVLIALGIPPVLMSLNSSSDAWASVVALVEKLSNWRKIMSIWLEKICNQVAEYNGYEGVRVKVKWDRMHLANDTEVKNLLLAFYDRGLISIKTALEDANYNIENETEHKKAEEKVAEKFMPPALPFSGKDGVDKNGDKIVEKTKPNDNSTKSKDIIKKKTSSKTETTVNMKEEKGNKPKAPGK